MKVASLNWNGVDEGFAGPQLADASFALYFGPNETIQNPVFQNALRQACPEARLLGCTTGTLIEGADIEDGAAGAVAVRLDKTQVKLASAAVSVAGSREAGVEIGRALASPELSGILLLCDSLSVDGADLIDGVRSVVGADLPISGGLASDGTDFLRTVVGADSMPKEGQVAALGFYGEHFKMGQGCAHGWDEFGPPRRITKAEGATLYELDGKPALDLYEQYLGEDAKDLPGSALRFPLLVGDPKDPTREVIRTVLNVDKVARTLTFASSVQEGWSARLMRGAFSRLAIGAADAAQQALQGGRDGEQGLALLVSCVGRRIVMGQNTADETEAVFDALSSRYAQIGFYSHGEISSAGEGEFCGLHNQTMTVVTFNEAA